MAVFVAASAIFAMSASSSPVVPIIIAVLCAAASAACRAPVSELRMRGPARTVFLRAARTLTTATARQIGVVGGVHNTTVLRAPHRSDRSTQVIEQVASDPRFAPLTEEDLRTRLTWRRYA